MPRHYSRPPSPLKFGSSSPAKQQLVRFRPIGARRFGQWPVTPSTRRLARGAQARRVVVADFREELHCGCLRSPNEGKAKAVASCGRRFVHPPAVVGQDLLAAALAQLLELVLGSLVDCGHVCLADGHRWKSYRLRIVGIVFLVWLFERVQAYGKGTSARAFQVLETDPFRASTKAPMQEPPNEAQQEFEARGDSAAGATDQNGQRRPPGPSRWYEAEGDTAARQGAGNRLIAH